MSVENVKIAMGSTRGIETICKKPKSIVDPIWDHLLNRIIPELLTAEYQNSDIQSIAVSELTDNDTFMADKPYIVDIHADNNRKKFLVKVTWQHAGARELLKINERFDRELTVYRELLPELIEQARELVPKFYIGRSGSGAQDFVVLEFLEEYRMSCGGVIMPDLEINMALHAIGRFQGYVYVFKETNPRKFDELKRKFDDYRFVEDRPIITMKPFVQATMVRSLEDFKMVTKYSPDVMRKLEHDVKDGYKMLSVHTEPVEPLAIITHSDFNRNNVMFKYIDNQPIDCKLIDFQMSTYARPTVDLALFIYLNSTHEQRLKHFDEFFDSYHSGILRSLDDAGLLTDANETKYSREAFMNDFRIAAPSALPIVGFFSPQDRLPDMGFSLEEFAIKYLAGELDWRQRVQEFLSANYPSDKMTKCLTHVVETCYL